MKNLTIQELRMKSDLIGKFNHNLMFQKSSIALQIYNNIDCTAAKEGQPIKYYMGIPINAPTNDKHKEPWIYFDHELHEHYQDITRLAFQLDEEKSIFVKKWNDEEEKNIKLEEENKVLRGSLQWIIDYKLDNNLVFEDKYIDGYENAIGTAKNALSKQKEE